MKTGRFDRLFCDGGALEQIRAAPEPAAHSTLVTINDNSGAAFERPDVEFRSIDVEGMEQEVSSGFDLKNYPRFAHALVREMATAADDAGVHDGVFRRSQPLLSRKRDAEPAPSFHAPASERPT
jgi:hypothetical protein